MSIIALKLSNLSFNFFFLKKKQKQIQGTPFSFSLLYVEQYKTSCMWFESVDASHNYAELINSKSVYQQQSVAAAFSPRGTNKGLSPAFLLQFVSKANQYENSKNAIPRTNTWNNLQELLVSDTNQFSQLKLKTVLFSSEMCQNTKDLKGKYKFSIFC